MDPLPKLDREAYRERMRAEVDRVLKEVGERLPHGARHDPRLRRLRWR
jgi:hypothetical protein